MQAVVYEEKNLFVRTERPVPALQKPTDALIRVTLAVLPEPLTKHGPSAVTNRAEKPPVHGLGNNNYKMHTILPV